MQAAIAPLTSREQEDLEHNAEASAMTSATSIDDIPAQGHERDFIVGKGQGGSDTAAQVVASAWSRNHLIAAYAL